MDNNQERVIEELKRAYGIGKKDTTPKKDGYSMPGEWNEHEGTIIAWPYRDDNWGRTQDEEGNVTVLGQVAFAEVARKIADYEKVYMFVNSEEEKNKARELINHPNVVIEIVKSNDAWARDMAGIGVLNGNQRRILDFGFNAWGYIEQENEHIELRQLYDDVDEDRKFASEANSVVTGKRDEVYAIHNFILEGGSIHVDGNGNIITTEECLLNPGRRFADFGEYPDGDERRKILEKFDNLSKEEKKELISDILCEHLGGDRVIWLERGIVNDETSGHVDNICCFVKPGEVALAWPPEADVEANRRDPLWLEDWQEQLEVCEENERRLLEKGIKVHKIPLPQNPIRITEEESKRVVSVDGTLPRNEGDRLAASYINFYHMNGAVLIPSFGEESDKKALEAFKRIYEGTGREIIQLSQESTRQILLGGGNIHCITQQIIKGDI